VSLPDFCRQLLTLAADRQARPEPTRRPDIAVLRTTADGLLDAHGRATDALQDALLTIEAMLRPRFTLGAAAAFQTWVAAVGGRMRGPIALPEDDTPFWQLHANPLAGFRSAASLPEQVDLIIIGAGLTGASAAYHAVDLVREGRRVAVVEMGDPCSQASGRNGGNFELMPENFLGPYEGLVRERYKYLNAVYPRLDEETLRTQAARQAALIIGFGTRNGTRFDRIVTDEKLDCDYSPRGWLRIADSTEEELALREEVDLVGDPSLLVVWDRDRIAKELGLQSNFGGRCAPKSGNYHPRKFVIGLLQAALEGGIELYNRLRVDTIVTGAGPSPIVCTAEGDIVARRVIVATNAFTSELFPELARIQCYQSQIMNLEHVADRLRGMTVTEEKGDLYYNFPGESRYVDAEGVARGMLLVGGGLDRPAPAPEDLARSASVLGLTRTGIDRRFPDTRGQPPSRVWTGPMAFTPDRLPVIGFLRRGGDPHGVLIAAGFNGYGGSYCVEAGYTAVEMIRRGTALPGVPEDVFSPDRFLVEGPLFPVGARAF
jgi:glycine/D-amino acid oxidase-like deaminating enzyme